MRLSFGLVVFMGYKSNLSTKKGLEVNMNPIDGSLLRTGTRGTGIWWREPTEAWMQQEKKGDVCILPFSDSQKSNIQKGSRKLDETWIFKLL